MLELAILILEEEVNFALGNIIDDLPLKFDKLIVRWAQTRLEVFPW